VIAWLNGSFGAGKTTTARELASLLGARTFDTEFVGYLLRTAFPQTILVEAYAREIFDGLAERGIPVAHFVLHAPPADLRRRISGDTADPHARQWRLDHVDRYGEALPWLRRSATLVETGGKTPSEVAREIAAVILRHDVSPIRD